MFQNLSFNFDAKYEKLNLISDQIEDKKLTEYLYDLFNLN